MILKHSEIYLAASVGQDRDPDPIKNDPDPRIDDPKN
jgi:hypothetical protein